MTLSFELRRDISAFLLALPDISNERFQRSLLLEAGLDESLTQQLQFAAPAVFVPHLLDHLVKFGALDDGRNALIAVLNAAKRSVGKDRRAVCDALIDAVRKCPVLPKQDSPAITFTPGSAPPLPATKIIGREDALADLKARLSKQSAGAAQVLTAIRGWPGIGKTTMAQLLAHDQEIAQAFPDGVLWVSLGQKPDVIQEMAAWGRALGTDEILKAKSVAEARAQLTALLRKKRMLLIVDDAWETAHAEAFRVGGRECAMLVTTRRNDVAHEIAPTPDDIYPLPILTEAQSMELLGTIAKKVVAHYPEPCRELARELEGLPLALHVAGHLLNVEMSYGFGVMDLLTELRVGAKLLAAKAPADRVDLANETTPTVAVLLQKSTDHLDEFTRDCFAYLGPFAPKPATFDFAAMQIVWQIDEQTTKTTIRALVDRGLLEFVADFGRYQMHALLVMHAKSLLTD